jgi:D-threonate/D-erythronate kinase
MDGLWQLVSTDLVAGLAALGHGVHPAATGEAVPTGLSIWDAETDTDLDRIVAAAAGLDRVLWVGSGGLAAALAQRFGQARRADSPLLPRPILGLFGTNHPVVQKQLAAVTEHHETVHDSEEAERVARLVRQRDPLLLSVTIPAGTARDEAARRIDATLAALVRRLDPPGTLIVAGGETLRGLCQALDAVQLDVTGEVMPGVPRSVLRGGSWDGAAIVSKSGAFGAPDLLRRLITPAPAPSKE